MRTIIEKYQRLEQIMEQYSEQIKELGSKQLEIYAKVIREFKLESDYMYREYLHYDWLEVGEGGCVELWEHGRCGDSDSYSVAINVDPLIIKEDFAGYEQQLRKQLEAKAAQVALA